MEPNDAISAGFRCSQPSQCQLPNPPASVAGLGDRRFGLIPMAWLEPCGEGRAVVRSSASNSASGHSGSRVCFSRLSRVSLIAAMLAE